MTDTYDSDDDATDEPSPRDLRHQLAERAREAEQLKVELETLKRDAEFSKALGESADAPWVKYFRSGYEGDVNAEAIRKAASEAGFLNQPAQAPQPEDVSAYARMASAAGGADGPGKVDWREALAEADRISNEADREAAILSVVEKYGGVTSRTAQ